jgi:Ala-tRNA(Pro) deacylase
MDRIITEAAMLAYLDENSIAYQRIEHPPVYTCEEATQFRPLFPAMETKNLFLRDEKRRFYLAVTACEKRLDMRGLGRALNAPKLHFASPEQLLECLGLTPGSVTILGLVNDSRRAVQLVVDGQYWPAQAYLCHPLVNTATLVLDHPALERFFALTGHVPQVVDMPGR